MAAAVFFVYAAVALAAGVVVVAARTARVAVQALLVCLIAGCCAYVQMLAPAVAAVQLVMLAGAGVAALRLAVGDEVVVRRRWVAAGALLPLLPIMSLSLLLVGTWARQYVWAGRELPPGTRFGGAAAVGQAWSEAHAPALLAVLLALLVVAIAGTSRRGHRL
jgi:NADH:ubiquinone oxidoreductase subunit 6 (subunit J)